MWFHWNFNYVKNDNENLICIINTPYYTYIWYINFSSHYIILNKTYTITTNNSYNNRIVSVIIHCNYIYILYTLQKHIKIDWGKRYIYIYIQSKKNRCFSPVRKINYNWNFVFSFLFFFCYTEKTDVYII